MSALLAGLAASAASSAVSKGTEMVSQALGLSMSQKEAMEKQQEYNKEIMALQNEYNVESAAKSQEYAKDYWDYTSTENQVKHMKNSGLNIGLMYGQGGAGGAGQTGGAKQESVSMPQGNPVEMGLRIQALEQERRLQDAQIAETYAKAKEAEANADFKNGTETNYYNQLVEESKNKVNNLVKDGKYKDALTELTKAQEEVAKVTKGNILADTWKKTNEAEEALNNALKILEETGLIRQQAKEKGLQNDILEATKEEQIKAWSLSNAQIVANIAMANSNIKLNDAKINEIAASIQELTERATKHKWDRETLRKEVNGQIKRWGEMTGNEKWHLTNEQNEILANSMIKAVDVITPW